jgi:hypothetical protein
MLCQPVATFRPKWITARIATVQQIVWRIATVRIKKKYYLWTCAAVRQKKEVMNMCSSLS